MFPVLVYRCPGPHQRMGGTYAYQAANNEAQFQAALADGWFSTMVEAIESTKPKPEPEPVIADDAPPTRAELEQKAGELGIKFDGRTGDKKLAALIAEQLKG